MAVNLHIFNDSLGFFTNKTVHFIKSLSNEGDVYINTATNCKNKSESILYEKLSAYLIKDQISIPDKVIFHSYNYTNQHQIKQIKKRFNNFEIKFIWIFWSHEYYQLPEFFSSLYKGFSRKFYLRKLLSFHLIHFIQFLKGEVSFPFYMGLSYFQRSFNEFTFMAALLKGDYSIVMKNNKSVEYAFVSYISTADFPEIKLNFDVEKNEVMVGHSGSPILNHYEVFEELSNQGFSHNIFVPLSYGKASYIKKLKNKVSNNISNLSFTFQTEYLSKDAYYKRIDSVGYFVLNSYCQQALGNIFFFLWAGTKVFLRKNTSSYITLKEKGFYIFSIEDDFIGKKLTSLTKEEKLKNHELTNSMIGNEQVKDSWLNILNL